METEEALVAKGRMNSYTWLSNFYLAEPSFETLRALLAEDVLSALEGLFMSEGAGYMKRLKEFAQRLDEGATVRVKREYQRLFSLSMKSGYVPPYESCIRGRSSPTRYGSFWGEGTNEVSNLYRSAGFDPIPQDDMLAPDHLGLELVFMSVLCSREVEALEKDDREEVVRLRDLELKFLSEHLMKWLGGYVADLKTKTGGVYSSIASLTKIFVEGDSEMLSSEIPRG